MPWGYAAVAAGTLLAGSMQADSAEDAANTQAGATREGIAEQRRQFDAIQKLLSPYVQAGTGALTAQQNLVGLGGQAAQQQAIDALQQSPMFQALVKQGENSILANASATGGLRGGNTQAALAQFSPALLAATINDQYAKLGGLTSLGQNAAAGVGNAGMATGNQVTSLLQQQGAALASGQLAAGRAYAGLGNSLAGFGGYYLATRPASGPAYSGMAAPDYEGVNGGFGWKGGVGGF